MAYDKEGNFFSFFGSDWDLVMSLLVVWECFALVLLVALWSYLTFTNTRIPKHTLRHLQACNVLGILQITIMVILNMDNAPPILSWMVEFISYIQMLLVAMLNMEFFKKISILGGHFSAKSVTTLQYGSVIWYTLCIGIVQCGYLVNLGHASAPLIHNVQNRDNLVVRYREV